MANELRNFLELSYDELEQLNLESKEQRKNRVTIDKIQEALGRILLGARGYLWHWEDSSFWRCG